MIDTNPHKSEGVRTMTHGDQIRAMSDEELAVLLCKCCEDAEYCEHCPASPPNCPGESVGAWEEWLKQLAEVSGDGN